MPHPILPIRTTSPSPPLINKPSESKMNGFSPSPPAVQPLDHLGPCSNNERMKAVQFLGKPGEMVVRHIPRPRITEPCQLLVRITTAAICGLDLHTYHGLFGGSDVPFTMGHEAVGVVSEVGSEVTDFRPGDRVIVLLVVIDHSPILFYGEGNLYGENIGGLQAEYALAPTSAILRKIPPGFDNELDYLLLSDNFPTGWWAVTQSGFEAGDVIAIYGAGPVGLMAVYSALLRGASKVYAIDRIASRLETAKSLGAIPIDLSKGLPSAQIMALEPNGVKRVCDCSGFECVNVQNQPEESFILNDAIQLVSLEGGISIYGDYYGAEPTRGQPLITPARGRVEFDIGTWWKKNPTMKGGPVNTEVDAQLMALIQSGRAKPSFVFDKIVSIDEAPEAYRLFSERKIQKTAIRFFP